MNQRLKDIYFNPTDPGSFSSPLVLYKRAKQLHVRNVTIDKVKQFLRSIKTYYLFTNPRRKFKRVYDVSFGIDYKWESDLLVLPPDIARANGNTTYLLCIIDSFSLYAWVEPLKGKNAQSVLTGFQNVWEKSHRIPSLLHVDEGTEYKNAIIRQFMNQHKVHMYSTENYDTKAYLAENFIRQIKRKIFRYLYANNTKRFLEALPDIVYSYNHTRKKALFGRYPAQITPDLTNEIYTLRKMKQLGGNKHTDLKVGDQVVIKLRKNVFGKYYKQNWLDKVYFIEKIAIKNLNQPLFKLKDPATNEILDGRFYRSEIQKILP